MRIGERLIREELLTPAQLDEGLRAQVLHGGRLGTNLVELGHLSIDVLAEALGRHHGMPAALGKHFEQASPELQARLPMELAAQWHAVPMGRLLGGDDHIAVAVMDPLAESAVAELAQALGGQVVLAVSPELRLLYHLEQVYGIPRSNRFLRVRPDELPGIADPTDDDAYCEIEIHIRPEPHERNDEFEPGYVLERADADLAPAGSHTGAAHQAHGLAEAALAAQNPEEPAPASAPSPAPVAATTASPSGPERRRFVQPLSEAPRPDAPAHLGRIAIKRISQNHTLAASPPFDALATMDEVLRAIRQATGRDRVGDLVITGLRDFFGGILDTGILLVIRDSIAIGWKGFVRNGKSEVVEAVAMPLNRPSVVFEPFTARKPYIGEPRGDGADLDQRLWTLLRSPPPRTVAAAPILLEETPVCLLYAHSTVAPDEATAIIGDGLEQLAGATSKAFARLIRAAQR